VQSRRRERVVRHVELTDALLLAEQQDGREERRAGRLCDRKVRAAFVPGFDVGGRTRLEVQQRFAERASARADLQCGTLAPAQRDRGQIETAILDEA